MSTVQAGAPTSEARDGDRVGGRVARERGLLRPLDVILLGYLVAASALVIAGRDHVARWWAWPLGYAAVADGHAATVVHRRAAVRRSVRPGGAPVSGGWAAAPR